jgi:hypothetical protein
MEKPNFSKKRLFWTFYKSLKIELIELTYNQSPTRSSPKSMINFFTEPKIKNKCEIEKNNFEFWFWKYFI